MARAPLPIYTPARLSTEKTYVVNRTLPDDQPSQGEKNTNTTHTHTHTILGQAYVVYNNPKSGGVVTLLGVAGPWPFPP